MATSCLDERPVGMREDSNGGRGGGDEGGAGSDASSTPTKREKEEEDEERGDTIHNKKTLDAAACLEHKDSATSVWQGGASSDASSTPAGKINPTFQVQQVI